MSVTVKMGNQQFLLRGHGLVTGLSGTGKTVALRNLERGLTETYKSTTLKIEVVAFEGDPDIFDARVNTAIGAIPAWAHCYPRVVIIIDGVLNCTDVTLSRLRQSMLVYDEGTPINYIVADTYLSAARFVGVQFGLLVRTIFRCHEYTLSVQEVSTREVSSVWISAEDLAVVHTQIGRAHV